MLALLVVLASGVAIGLWQRVSSGGGAAVDQSIHQFEVELSADAIVGSEVGTDIVLSRDGARVVWVARDVSGVSHLFTRRWERPEVTRLPGTEGARNPFVSPDGRWIGFWAVDSLKKTSSDGGAPVVVCATPGLAGASWGDDNTIVFAQALTHQLWRVSAKSARSETILDLTSESGNPAWPQILPGGEYVLYTVMTPVGADSASIEVLSLRTGKRTVVRRNGTFGRYLSIGYVTLQVNQGTLYAIRFDPNRAAIESEGVSLVEDVAYPARSDTPRWMSRRTAPSCIDEAPRARRWWSTGWIDREDRRRCWRQQAVTPGRGCRGTAVLPSWRTEGGTTTLRVHDPRSGEMKRFSSPAGEYGGLMWWPNLNRLVLAGSKGMTWIDVEQPLRAGSLTTSGSLQVPWSVTPDGSRLAYYEMSRDTRLDIWTMPVLATERGFRDPNTGTVPTNPRHRSIPRVFT